MSALSVKKILREAMQDKVDARRRLSRIFTDTIEANMSVRTAMLGSINEVYREDNDLPPCPPLCPTLKDIQHG